MSALGWQSRIEMEQVLDAPGVRIMRARPKVRAVDGLAVVFCSANQPDAIYPEFCGRTALIGKHALFVIETDRAWFARPGLVDLVAEEIRAEMVQNGLSSLVTLGLSLGAFPALSFAQQLPVDLAVSFSPRFSPDRRIVPDPRLLPEDLEPGWSFAAPTVEAGLRKVKAAVVIHGTLGYDRPHLRRFPDLPHVEHLVLPGAGHVSTLRLRERGQLSAVVDAALRLDKTAVVQAVTQAGGLPRRHVKVRGRLLIDGFAMYLERIRIEKILHHRDSLRGSADKSIPQKGTLR